MSNEVAVDSEERTAQLLALDAAEERARAVLERAEWDAQKEWSEIRRGTAGAVQGWRILMLRAEEASENYRSAMRRRMLAEIG